MVLNPVPQLSMRCSKPRQMGMFLPVFSAAVGCPLLPMSRDAAEREDIKSHKEFASGIGHF